MSKYFTYVCVNAFYVSSGGYALPPLLQVVVQNTQNLSACAPLKNIKYIINSSENSNKRSKNVAVCFSKPQVLEHKQVPNKYIVRPKLNHHRFTIPQTHTNNSKQEKGVVQSTILADSTPPPSPMVAMDTSNCPFHLSYIYY